MTQYIQKAAVVAEIERLVNNYDKALDYEAALEDVRNFIDSLEIKEVDSNDAFIEKAENFLEMLGYGFIITDNITHTNYDKEQLIEDFRNYMGGE